MTSPKLQYLTVPAGSRVAECRGCGAPIYFVKNERRKFVPVNCAHDEQCREPTALEDGCGINHFQDCPKADRFH